LNYFLNKFVLVDDIITELLQIKTEQASFFRTKILQLKPDIFYVFSQAVGKLGKIPYPEPGLKSATAGQDRQSRLGLENIIDFKRLI
jgi:hypothetical protein